MSSSHGSRPMHEGLSPAAQEVLGCLAQAEEQRLSLGELCTFLQDESGDSVALALEELETAFERDVPISASASRPSLDIRADGVSLHPILDPEERTRFRERFARRRMERNQIPLAQRALYRLLAEHQEQGDKRGQALDLGNLATLFLTCEETDTAERLLGEAILLHEETEDPYGLALDQANLGLVFAQQERFDEARERLEQARAAFEHLGCTDEAEKSRQNLERLAQLSTLPRHH